MSAACPPSDLYPADWQWTWHSHMSAVSPLGVGEAVDP